MAEVNVLRQIIDCIENKEHFCLDAGAGSGKTYKLVQTIEYVLKQYGSQLSLNNQKIMVITFTNAAAEEIKKRIGNTQNVEISTIHTRLWEIIKPFQNELVRIHLDKINKKIDELKNVDIKPFSSDEKIKKHIEEDKGFLDEFYKNQNIKAKEFKEKFSKYTQENNISNVGDFKKFVNNYSKYLKYENAKNNINKKAKNYVKVEYDLLNNSDRLYRMKFSHDTLLEYSEKIINSNKILKRLIKDKYPFVFVDEYQDTATNVITLLNILGSDNDKKICIGFFGDSCQNIYDYGIGTKLNETFSNFKLIQLEDNRRSVENIVEISNKIRNDSLKQHSLNTKKGTVGIYYTKSTEYEIVSNFISTFKQEFSEKQIHCLVLKNDFVVSKLDFDDFYKILKNTDYYKNNFNQVTTEILSSDTKTLGKIPNLLYKITDLIKKIFSPHLFINNYVPADVYNRINFEQLKEIYKKLKLVDCKNLKTLIKELFFYTKEDENIKEIVKNRIDNVEEFEYDYEKIFNYVLHELYWNLTDENIDDAKSNINNLFDMDFKQLKNWYKYINSDSKDNETNEEYNNFYYHTFHGSKGLEFNNSIVILTNDFNRKTDYYHTFFKEYNDIDNANNEEYIKRRNLLYVAITRAKENLRLLYVDPNFDEIKDNFEQIFGKAVEWKYANETNE